MDQTKYLMELTTERTYKIERKKLFLKTEIREQMRERARGDWLVLDQDVLSAEY